MNDLAPPPLDADLRAEQQALRRRRLLLAVLVTATIAGALLAMIRLLGGDGALGPADLVLLACFAAMLPWNVLGFWNAAIGFLLLRTSRDPVARVLPAARAPMAGPIRARVAILMPVHNEDPERVLRHLEATVASLDATGEGRAFEVFLLSDTRIPALAEREEALFARWRARHPWPERLHYRRRADNLGHKTGNLWEWLEREGERFDQMLVLDADSVMSGTAILRLVRIMAARPEIGILQQLVVGLPNPSPFARLFQFGMRHGMRAYTMGSAWWQGDCGPYWGHNALIRIAPFMAHCRLPVLPGGPPLGGRILSHDQVEAVLMRRAGWQVRVVPEEDGSFEENPPTLSDFIKRDLRWCQGNWQYLHLLGCPGLHALGRLQLALAILMYVSGPAWILFSLVGFGRAILGDTAPAAPATPLLGVPGTWEGWALLVAMLVLVWAPKLAGVLQILLLGRLRRAYGGAGRVLVSAVVEILFSLVLAPIVAFAQTLFVLGMSTGRAIRWEAQLRDPRCLSWGEAWRGLRGQTLFGAALGAATWWLAPEGVLPWAVLFCLPLLLAVPFAVVTSWASLGQVLMRLGIGAVPEEIDSPAVVAAAGHALWPPPITAGAVTGGGAIVGALAAPPMD
ncbi:glucans biosynthesis glucosyltransferase MdoH [Benzoatithermus flavus]|uniref:Glucans biosynthesis glucosyltransferase H n=1 Tax=Benzoatithermus flavus TaxID=3108223 RepID=A0ABU8XVK1_9PROT